MQRSDLEKLSRKELQALAKDNGVKANLSNNDIITKLTELVVETSVQVEAPASPVVETVMSASKEEQLILETEPILDATVEEAMIPLAPVPPVFLSMEDAKTGDIVEVDVDGTWTQASIKRVNKKTIRICLLDGSEELTVKFSEIRPVQNTSEENAKFVSKMEEETAETTDKMNVVEVVADAPQLEIEIENIAAEDISSMVVVETQVAEEAAVDDIMVSEEQPTMKELPREQMIENAQAPSSPVSAPVIEAPPTAVSVILAPPTPVAAARVSSIGWNFALQDSAIKAGPSSNRRKARREARRSAMKQLAESMKMENLQAEADAEADADAETTDKSSNDSPEVEVVPEVVSEPHVQPEPIVVAVTATVTATVTAAVAVNVAPTPAPIVATTPAAPAPVSASVLATKGEVLPRMNKAQMMRLGANQKKIITTDLIPTESTAFTNKVSRPSVAMTPAHRNSISTSAPSSILNQPGAPFRKAATPLSGISGRASMLTTGTKRKMSDLGCNSANSNAPDFRSMHKKQFSSLKSIAECVDQDKTVGVRMTIAMESAINKTKTISAAVAPVVKPAANPFGKVVNKSAANTPSKAAATPAHLQASRPGSVHTASNVMANKTNGGGSSNIVKSRTVTSFVSGAAPSSCGHNNLTSFVNNENSHSTHNIKTIGSASSATSFLKGRDSIGAGKHRTVVLGGVSNIRQQHLTMM